jgi:hypothetical protein
LANDGHATWRVRLLLAWQLHINYLVAIRLALSNAGVSCSMVLPFPAHLTHTPLALLCCSAFRSLWECGGGIIADGRLLDLIRRVYTFGMSLLRLDLRQESTRHADALDAVTTYLGYGSYKGWDEDTKLDFLTRELTTKRPLIPLNMPMSDEVGVQHVGGGKQQGGCVHVVWFCYFTCKG